MWAPGKIACYADDFPFILKLSKPTSRINQSRLVLIDDARTCETTILKRASDKQHTRMALMYSHSSNAVRQRIHPPLNMYIVLSYFTMTSCLSIYLGHLGSHSFVNIAILHSTCRCAADSSAVPLSDCPMQKFWLVSSIGQSRSRLRRLLRKLVNPNFSS